MTASERIGLRPDLFEFAMYRIREMTAACQHRRPTFCEDRRYVDYLGGKRAELSRSLPYTHAKFYEAFHIYLGSRLLVRQRREQLINEKGHYTRVLYEASLKGVKDNKRLLRTAMINLTRELCPGVEPRM